MDFSQLTDVVKAASAACPGWVTTLLGWKQEERSSDNIEILQFGGEGDESLDEETFSQFRQIFKERWGENGGSTKTVPTALEVYDHLDNKDLEAIDSGVNASVDAMEEVTEETENTVEMDPELLDVMRSMHKDITTASPPTVPTPQEIDEVTSRSQLHPAEIALPLAKQASPKANLFKLQTPMAPRSHARIVRILEDDDEEPLKAPDFSQLGGDESDDYYTIQATASKLPVPLLQPAELETGWSTSLTIQPILNVHPSKYTPTATVKADRPFPNSPSGGSTQGDIITTLVLDQYGISFNTLYKLVICTSCAEGFPLRSLHTHLRREDNKRTNWDAGLKDWKSTDVVYENHRPDKIPSLKSFIKIIVDSLVSEGHIASEKDIRAASSQSDWKSLPLPKFIGKKRPQVLGLRLFPNVIQCTVEDDDGVMCGRITPGSASMKQHIYINHGAGHSRQRRLTTAQTLTEDLSWMHYFEVSSDAPLRQAALHKTLTLIDPSGFDVAAARELLQQTTATYTHDLHVTPDQNVKTILPTFIETGVDQFLRQFNRTTLRKNYDPNPDNAMYSTLRALVIDTYSDNIKQLVEGRLPDNILLHVTNCTPISKPHMRRSFLPLKEKKSIAAYALLEFKFVWAVIQAKKKPKKKPKNNAYTFNEKQAQALDHLWGALGKLDLEDDDGNNHFLSTAINALYSLFDEFYFPEAYETKNTTFDMPSSAFLAIQCVTVDGSYLNIHLIPPIIAKLQYSFRLRAMRRIMCMRADIAEDSIFYEKFTEFCQKYLQDHNLSPFATLRTLLHKMSVASKSTPRPDMIWWHGDVVTVGEMSVNILEFKTFLGKKLEETENFVEEHILLGLYKLHELDDTCNISQLKDLSRAEDILGNGLLLDLRDGSFDNPESIQLFLKMLQHAKLGIKQDTAGAINFGKAQGVKWISDIDKALTITQSLCHITQGPGVGRMTEEALQTPINTLNSSRNFVFENGEQTGGFRSGYHKGSFTTGQHKEILRLLPYRVFRLLFVLIRIVRPIELTVLLDLLIAPENRQDAVDAYRERIWASYGQSWTPFRLSENLQRFMQRGVGVKMGARPYRHFAIAVQRHYPSTNYGRYETNPEKSINAHAADLMAGHIPIVAEMHYARKEGVLTNEVLKMAYIRVCKDWHTFLGFSTKRDD